MHYSTWRFHLRQLVLVRTAFGRLALSRLAPIRVIAPVADRRLHVNRRRLGTRIDPRNRRPRFSGVVRLADSLRTAVAAFALAALDGRRCIRSVLGPRHRRRNCVAAADVPAIRAASSFHSVRSTFASWLILVSALHDDLGYILLRQL